MKKTNLSAVIHCGILAIGFIYLLLCTVGITNTFWGWDARHSEWYWKLFTFLVTAFAAWLMYKFAAKMGGFALVALWALLALGFAGSTGFKGTAGDIKQRVTYLDNHGKVVDTSLLFNCYENFYKFNDNPELKKYVIEYGELPGRNLWNAFILAGDIPKSTAPRANEDFKWHTNAYEMDLKDKNCR